MTEMRSPLDHRRYTILAVLSLALLFFTVPHVLEDFSEGEPLKKGIPAPLLSFVVSGLLAAQLAGVYWLGQRRRRGIVVHAVLGVAWPLAAGVAQVSVILADAPYRSGAVSVAYVAGILLLGPALFVTSLVALRREK